MKKLLVLGLLLAMSSGCGRGWFPFFRNGAPCNNGLCSVPTMPQGGACEGCTSGAGYESYGDGGFVGESIGSAPIGPTYLDAPPAMGAPLPGPIVNPAK